MIDANPKVASVTPFSPAETEFIDLADLLRTINYHKWSMLAITLLVTVATAFYGFSLDRYYRATTTILIESRVKTPGAEAEADVPGVDKIGYFQTQLGILKSRDLIFQVIDKLDLTNNKEFEAAAPSLLSKALDWHNWLPFVDAPQVKTIAEDKKKEQLRESVAKAMLSSLSIEQVLGTLLVDINYEARDPALAADVTNTLAAIFVNSGLQARLDTAKKTSEWLSGKLGDVRGQLERSEKRLQDYREQHSLLNVVGGARTLDEDQLVETTKLLREAERKKSELASAYNKIKQAGSNPESLSEIPLLLLDERVTLASRGYQEGKEAFRQLSERYGAKHPSIAVARARFESARSSYYDSLRVASQGVKSQYEIAADNERSLAAVVSGSRNQIKNLDERQYDLNVLERDVKSNRELYDMFLTRFKEQDSVNSFEAIAARVIDSALVPRTPSKPNLVRLLVFGFIGGLGFALALTLLRHILSEQVRSADELEALTHLPVMGVLPVVDREDRSNVPLMFQKRPKSPFSESLRSVRVSLRLSDVDNKLKRILVTSSVPGEGKSSVSSGLALSYASSEQVLLIDADLRKPTVGKSFGLPDKTPGISDLLTGQAKLEDCLFQHQDSGLYVISAGRSVPNPAELLGSAAFQSFIDAMATRFQRIIFDSPPCHAAADCLQLSQVSDGVVFVVKSDATSRRVIRNSLKQLRHVRAHLVGLVVNHVDVSAASSNYQGYYAYGYYGRDTDST